MTSLLRPRVCSIFVFMICLGGLSAPAFAQWDPQCSSYCNPSVSCNDTCHVEYYTTTCGDYDYSNCAPSCYPVAGDPSDYWIRILYIDFYDCHYVVAHGYSRYDSCSGELEASPSIDSYCSEEGDYWTNSIQCEGWQNQGRVVNHCNW